MALEWPEGTRAGFRRDGTVCGTPGAPGGAFRRGSAWGVFHLAPPGHRSPAGRRQGSAEVEGLEVTLTFEKEKETRNTIRYQEKPAEGQPPIVGTLYVAKFWAGSAQQIKVTITKLS
jgi:hypothetical protein